MKQAVIINPYKAGSRGAKRLRDALRGQGLRVFTRQGQPKGRYSPVINWGNSSFDYDHSSRTVMNDPKLAGLMTNKRTFFRHVGHCPLVPEWTENRVQAMDWKSKLLARTVLEGSGGAGIVIWEPEMEKAGITFPQAPLYVKYQNKTHEYRLHMARGRVGGFEPILIQRKIFQKREGMEAPKLWEIRNHSNGFIFVQNSGYPTPEVVVETAKQFMTDHFSGLHFCALDIIFHEKSGKTLVLEGNTAPGLEGNTIEVYAKYFKEFFV